MTPPHRRGWRARCGRAGRRLSHSLKWRLVGLFLLLALATTITFIAGVHRMLDAAWDGYGRPLTTDRRTADSTASVSGECTHRRQKACRSASSRRSPSQAGSGLSSGSVRPRPCTP